MSDRARRDWTRQARRDRVIRARQAIADQRGDLEAFVALEQERGGTASGQPRYCRAPAGGWSCCGGAGLGSSACPSRVAGHELEGSW